jgi:hypothetical protein
MSIYRSICDSTAPDGISHGIEGYFIFVSIHGSICYRTATCDIEGDFTFISILLLVLFWCGNKRRSRRDPSAGIFGQRQVCFRTKVFLVVSIQVAQLEEPFVASDAAGALSAKLPRPFSFVEVMFVSVPTVQTGFPATPFVSSP